MVAPSLDVAQLAEIRDTLAARVVAGLAEPGEILAAPGHLRPPEPGRRGRALVLDTGGTNMRAAVVELDGAGGSRILAGPVGCPLPRSAGVDAARLWQTHVELARQLGPTAEALPIGFCFSYPSEVAPSHDARLLRWTKGLAIPGVEGEWVGAALRAALEAAGLRPGPVAVLNDTVAALLAGAQLAPDPGLELRIGLIAGTGTNMAAFLAGPRWPGLTAVNLESGNFDPPHRSPADGVVDARSDRPGAQRFEKMVSGYYLPFVFQAGGPTPEGFDPEAGSAALAALRDGGGPLGARAGAVLDRSADLVAAGLLGVAAAAGATGRVGVLAEGGLFWGVAGYAERVRSTLERLGGPRVELSRAEHANLVGAATAALEAP